jgi:hypothetical protein
VGLRQRIAIVLIIGSRNILDATGGLRPANLRLRRPTCAPLTPPRVVIVIWRLRGGEMQIKRLSPFSKGSRSANSKLFWDQVDSIHTGEPHDPCAK